MQAPHPESRLEHRIHHGRQRDDPYAWLRDDDRADADVLAHLRAENAHTDEVLAPEADLRETLFQEIKSRIQETDLSVPARRGRYWYYRRTIEGSQYGITCRLAAGDEIDPPDPDAPAVIASEQVVLDENAEAGDSDYYAVGALDLSPDDDTLAWSEDRNGSERYLLRFRDLATGLVRRLPDGTADEVADVYYSTAWSADGRSFFYTRMDHAHRPHEIWRHRLGTPAADDVRVFHEVDERFFVHVSETKDRRWIVISAESKTTSDVWLCPTDDADATFVPVAPRRAGIEVSVEHLDGTMYVLTNDDALDFRVLSFPVATLGAEASWDEVIAHRPGVRVEGVDVLADHLLVEERTEATTRVRLLRVSTGDETLLDQPEECSTVALGANADIDWPHVRHTYTSLVTPPTIIDLDLTTGERHIRKVQRVLGGYDPSAYASERRWAVAEDGTRVPVSVVHAVGRPPGGPVLLYGYGAYEISIDPYFSVPRLSLLDRGWAFAIAHVRGGGEMGRGWYVDGKERRKTNSFDDLVACGRMLVEDGTASIDGRGRSTVAIRGGSAGGLLVGAALNRAPGFWRAVVAEVPFVDALNSMLDPELPLTVTEWEEWGNPITDADVFDAMAAYSPYENVPSAELPSVLATAGLHDPRVGYWEPAKWVAALRDTAAGGPFLVRTEMDAGHGGPSGRYDAWKDEALILAFLLAAAPSDEDDGR